MANKKIFAMPVMDGAPASIDLFTIVDVSEPAATQNKSMTVAILLGASGDTELLRNSGGKFGGVANATSDGFNVTFSNDGLRATSPRFITDISDTNGNAIIGFTVTGSAVNFLNITNAATGGAVVAQAAGSDANIQLTIQSKGTGNVQISSSGEVRFGGAMSATIGDDGAGNTRIKVGASSSFGFSNDNNPNAGTVDCRLLRNGNGVVRAASNNNGTGSWLGGILYAAKTGNYTVTDVESGSFFTNEGAAGTVNFTLPAAASPNPSALVYVFYIQAAQTLTVTAGAGDTIRLAGSVSAAAGNISANTVGNCVKLVCINATEWVAESIVGTWTVT